ncbi:MAG: S41 family peptidase [Acidobacteriota bacterium]|nr:S41 family peptidase [Acidobacteriota bacterium]MDQ7088278.1 S41 family peptidase [Acidobacteriota bacterium]
MAASLALAAGFHQRGAYRYLSVFQEVWSLTVANYVEPVDQARLLDGAYRGMLASLDSASGYLSPGDEQRIAAPPGKARAGLQVLQSGGIPVVVRVDPGSPAEAAGLSRGDQIWRIDGRPTRTLPWSLLTRLLSGDEGQTLELEILDGSTFKLQEVSLALSASTAPPAVELERLDGGVIHLRLHDLDRVDPVRDGGLLARTLEAHPGAPLLVDLRGVVAVDPALVQRFGGWLLPAGASLKLVGRSGADQRIVAGAAPVVDLPEALFVLTDSSTAGVGEALAALLVETRRARSCGRKTYGLAGVPELIRLQAGGSVLLTTQEMRTPGGTAWSGEGIEPERVLPLPVGEDEAGADPLLDAARRWILSGVEAETAEAA